MWSPKRIERADVMPPTTPVGMTGVSGLAVDGLALTNAYSMLDWSTPEVHADVCSECGEPGCGSDPPLRLRHLAGDLIVLPARTDELGEAYVRGSFSACPALERGTLRIAGSQVNDLMAIGMKLKAPTKYPEMSGDDAVRIAYWDAPKGLLETGADGTRVRYDRLTGCSHGDVVEWAERIAGALDGEVISPVVLRSGDSADVVSLFLNEPTWEEWSPLAYHAGRLHLLLTDRVLAPVGS